MCKLTKWHGGACFKCMRVCENLTDCQTFTAEMESIREQSNLTLACLALGEKLKQKWEGLHCGRLCCIITCVSEELLASILMVYHYCPRDCTAIIPEDYSLSFCCYEMLNLTKTRTDIWEQFSFGWGVTVTWQSSKHTSFLMLWKQFRNKETTGALKSVIEERFWFGWIWLAELFVTESW